MAARVCEIQHDIDARICQQLSGNEVEIEPVAEERPGDVPVYISDCSVLFDQTEWRPRHSAEQTLREDALPDALGVAAARN